MQPTVGRIVLYQRHGSPNGQHRSEPSPAIVTRVCTEIDRNPLVETLDVDLCVFNPNGVYFNANTRYDPEGGPGTWRWPPRS